MDKPPPDTLRAIKAVEEACIVSEEALRHSTERRLRISATQYSIIRMRTKVRERP